MSCRIRVVPEVFADGLPVGHGRRGGEDLVARLASHRADDLDEERLLAGEMLVDGLLRHRRSGRHLVHARAEIARKEKDLGGGGDDRGVLARRTARPFLGRFGDGLA